MDGEEARGRLGEVAEQDGGTSGIGPEELSEKKEGSGRMG